MSSNMYVRIPETTMLTKQEHKVTGLNFVAKLFGPLLSSSHKPKTHKFSDQLASVNYEFEVIEGGRAQMTGYGKGIKQGDYIIFTKDQIRYQVEEIEYYCNPPDLWTALLSRCSERD